MRPRGTPPTPSAMSTASAPVGMTSILFLKDAAPSRMMAPSPKAFVMELMAASRSRCFCGVSWEGSTATAFSAAFSTFFSEDFAGMEMGLIELRF